jgi:hypothetical protein
MILSPSYSVHCLSMLTSTLLDPVTNFSSSHDEKRGKISTGSTVANPSRNAFNDRNSVSAAVKDPFT